MSRLPKLISGGPCVVGARVAVRMVRVLDATLDVP